MFNLKSVAKGVAAVAAVAGVVYVALKLTENDELPEELVKVIEDVSE